MIHKLLEGMVMVARASGAKAKIQPRKKLIDETPKTGKNDPNYVPTVEEALMMFGAKAGTIIERGK